MVVLGGVGGGGSYERGTPVTRSVRSRERGAPVTRERGTPVTRSVRSHERCTPVARRVRRGRERAAGIERAFP